MSDGARKARLFLGLAVVLALFLGETVVADRRLPNPASPIVWTALGAGIVACLALAAWHHVRSRSK
jgi:hypothetical protein